MKKKIFISVILVAIVSLLILFIHNIFNKKTVACEDIMKEITENEETEKVIADSNPITEVVSENLTVEDIAEDVTEEQSKIIIETPTETLEPSTIENGSGESVGKITVVETPKKDSITHTETTPPTTIDTTTTTQTEEKAPSNIEETEFESKETITEDSKTEETVSESQETSTEETISEETTQQETSIVPKEQYIRNDDIIEQIRTVIDNNVTEDMKIYGYTVVPDSSIKTLTNQFTFTENRVKSAISSKFGTIRIYAEDYYYNGQFIMTECYII